MLSLTLIDMYGKKGSEYSNFLHNNGTFLPADRRG